MEAIADILYPIKPARAGQLGKTPGPAGFVKLRRASADRQVYEQVRSLILRGDLAPGQWLRQEVLAASFGVSRMPIRDAFRTLASEGLVEVLPHRGVRVAPLSVEELEELYAMRLGLEGLAARLGANEMSPATLGQMTELLRRLEALCRSGDLEAFLRTEAAYHQVCYAASGRERLCRTVADLRERATRYLRVVFDEPSRFQESITHQRQLLKACERRDGAAAEQSLQDALRWTLRHLDEFFSHHQLDQASGA